MNSVSYMCTLPSSYIFDVHIHFTCNPNLNLCQTWHNKFVAHICSTCNPNLNFLPNVKNKICWTDYLRVLRVLLYQQIDGFEEGKSTYNLSLVYRFYTPDVKYYDTVDTVFIDDLLLILASLNLLNIQNITFLMCNLTQIFLWTKLIEGNAISPYYLTFHGSILPHKWTRKWWGW